MCYYLPSPFDSNTDMDTNTDTDMDTDTDIDMDTNTDIFCLIALFIILIV